MKKYIQFLGQLLFLILAIAFYELLLHYSGIRLFPTLGADSLIFATLTMIIVFRKNIDFKQFYSNINIGYTLIFACLASILIYVISMGIEALYKEYYAPLEPSSFTASYILLTVFLTPIIEEICCRIIIINRFSGKIVDWLIIVGTGVFFAFLHIKNIQLIISTFLFGLILGYFFIRTKNGLLLILIHFFYNLLFVIINHYFYKMNTIFVYAGMNPYKTMVIIAVMLFLIFYIFRKQMNIWLQKTVKLD